MQREFDLTLLFLFLQDAAQRQENPAERRAEHPRRRTAQQVPVPQHHGAQRAGQEDRNHPGHRKYRRGPAGGAAASAPFNPRCPPLFSCCPHFFSLRPPLSTRSWTTFWRSTESRLISEVPPSRLPKAVLYRMERILIVLLWPSLCTLDLVFLTWTKEKNEKKKKRAAKFS